MKLKKIDKAIVLTDEDKKEMICGLNVKLCYDDGSSEIAKDKTLADFSFFNEDENSQQNVRENIAKKLGLEPDKIEFRSNNKGEENDEWC